MVRGGALSRPKTIAALLAYGGASVAVIALAAIGLGNSWAFERELFFVRASGWCALGALAAALCARPIGRVIGRVIDAARDVDPFVGAARRALGITAAALATLHGVLAASTYLRDALGRLLELAWIRGGLLAWLVLAALWITSYPRVVRALRVRSWKPLHRLAYAAALLAMQHTLMSPLAPRGYILTLFGVVIAIALFRLVPQRRSTPSQASNQPQI